MSWLRAPPSLSIALPFLVNSSARTLASGLVPAPRAR
ncbi:hypothetical protein BC937DRAFT_94224 [Endogone sp. FLAS-F59071]|nr:hypothetical protein BC937DRAFT_94224 [Endogone sp. FLAS-F59071]|eukprot:RUS14182.1 hypothetical protein BC937DRAFT_94224 [Endogone sp. FLAS-F59071]